MLMVLVCGVRVSSPSFVVASPVPALAYLSIPFLGKGSNESYPARKQA
jgi:hypothetical protein